ncbi:MAG: thiamine pyrophosphate-binding protein [Alphaproteobacteria bacterium]|nr:thiamine pyrophosphate-binding protein [Alphaproteobacteria bacterium]
MNKTSGSRVFLSLLKDEGVTHLFGNPGTTELPLMDALKDHPDLTYVLGLQESVVVTMADGFARASGKLAACNVHVAPGLGNAMGAIYNAKFTGSPLLITAGQQEQGHGLTEPVLYDPLVPIATPLVKWAVEITRLEDMPRIVRRAAKIATTPPTGPVFLSLPGDVLNDEKGVDLGQSTRVDCLSRPTDDVLARLAARLVKAERPALLVGHEVVTSDAFDEIARFAEILGAPAYQQTVPYGAHFPSEHPAFMGALSRDQKEVRKILAEHDLLIVAGADVLRMSVWQETDPLPPELPLVQLGQLDWEMGKNYPAEIAIRADLKATIEALIPVLETKGGAALGAAAAERLADVADRNWSAKRDARRLQSTSRAAARPVASEWLMMQIVDALPADAVLVNEGLTSANSLLDMLPFRDVDGFHAFASGGIGWAIAAAVGIQLARPERPLVAVIGDGSAMYTIQALWTAAHLNLPITYVIANNQGYRILKQRLKAFHGNDHFIGMDIDDPPINFSGLARSFGLTADRIEEPGEIAGALKNAIASRRPTLLEVMVERTV